MLGAPSTHLPLVSHLFPLLLLSFLYREVKQPVQGHIANKWQNQHLNCGLFDLVTIAEIDPLQGISSKLPSEPSGFMPN